MRWPRHGFYYCSVVAAFFFIFSVFVFIRSWSVRDLTQKGVLAFQEQKFDAAERMFVRSLVKLPGNAFAYLNLGFLYEKKKEYVQAITAYEKVLELTRDKKLSLLAHKALASLYGNAEILQDMRRPEWSQKALGHAKVVAEAFPNDAGYQLQLGFAYFNAANPGGGFEAFSRASVLAKGKDSLWVHEKLKEVYTQMHMLDKVDIEQKIIDAENGQ
jgi:tetratricopeptide (TPR) repeat protein